MSTNSASTPENFWENLPWLNEHIKIGDATIVSANLVAYPNAGGLANIMQKIKFDMSTGESKTFVYKSLAPEKKQQSANLGQP